MAKPCCQSRSDLAGPLRASPLAACCAAAPLASGCRAVDNAQVDVLERELRQQEDYIYELEDYLMEYSEKLRQCRSCAAPMMIGKLLPVAPRRRPASRRWPTTRPLPPPPRRPSTNRRVPRRG